MAHLNNMVRMLAVHDQSMESGIAFWNTMSQAQLELLLNTLKTLHKSDDSLTQLVACFATVGLTETCVRAEARLKEDEDA